MRSGACGRCGRSIVWAVTGRGGKMPLDMDSDDGDFVLPSTDEDTGLPNVRRRIYFTDDVELQRYRFHVCAGDRQLTAA